MIFRELFISKNAIAQSKLTERELARQILRAQYRPNEFHYYHGRDHTDPQVVSSQDTNSKEKA